MEFPRVGLHLAIKIVLFLYFLQLFHKYLAGEFLNGFNSKFIQFTAFQITSGKTFRVRQIYFYLDPEAQIFVVSAAFLSKTKKEANNRIPISDIFSNDSLSICNELHLHFKTLY